MYSGYRRMEVTDIDTVVNLPLRPADKTELQAATGFTNTVAGLKLSLMFSEHTWVIVWQGEIEGVFGLGFGGHPWMFATDKFKEFRFRFTKESKRVIDEMLNIYPTLHNVVSSLNRTAIVWLQWLGFTVDKEHPYYFFECGVPFYRFYLKR